MLIDLIEAGSGKRGWTIRVIRGGLSANSRLYPDPVLRAATPLFEGAAVHAVSDADHVKAAPPDARNIIAGLKRARYVEGQNGQPGEIHADLILLEPEGPLATRMAEAWAADLKNLFGFSIHAYGRARKERQGGKQILIAESIDKVASVDLVSDPAAGGGFVGITTFTESKDPAANADPEDQSKADDKGSEKPNPLAGLTKLLEARGLSADELEKLEGDALLDRLTEAVAPPEKAPAPEQPEKTPGSSLDILALVEAREAARDAVRGSSLPDRAKARLLESVRGCTDPKDLTPAKITALIEAEAAYIGGLTDKGRGGAGDAGRVTLTESQGAKTADMLDAFFDPEHKDHGKMSSFREAYASITGDLHVTGDRRRIDQTRLTEALDSASLPDALGDAMARRLKKEYARADHYQVWRQLVDVVPLGDFREQQRVAWGGYGEVPVVAQAGPYPALTSPTDEKATYSVAKRGGTETVTLEMIKNDDVGVIRRIPVKMAAAAKRTLARFVMDMIAGNPVIYDGATLFHATHNNLGTAALSSGSLAAGRLAMLKQTESGSGEPLGIGPEFLLVPPELEETAVDLFRRNTNQDKTFAQSLSLTVVPVWYWTDPNDWYLAASPRDIAGIEIGFVDGQEEPEIFVQDLPTNGGVFTHDQITYKIRHIYGGGVLDWRGLYGGRVA